MNRNAVIAEIALIQDALEKLEVKRERFSFGNLSDEEIAEIRESISEQLNVRKRFLQRAGSAKSNKTKEK